MQKGININDESEEYKTKEYKEEVLNNYWDKWLIFKKNHSKDYQIELRKHLPPYFDSNVNKINEFSMRENIYDPPCPQEFLEYLINGIFLRNELGLYRSKYYYYKELQQLLIEYLTIFYFRKDTIIDIFQSNTKLSCNNSLNNSISINSSKNLSKNI